MRIISGEARGRTIFAPKGDQTRPTSDKIRGSMFNIIGARVAGARVLDLFGGSGALALEALSRGAASALIADASRTAAQVIERNARAVVREDFDRRVRILRADYRAAIERACATVGRTDAANDWAGTPFDLVFLDPPYRMTDAYGDALDRLEAARALDPGCLVVMERLAAAEVGLPVRFERLDARRYGDTVVEFVGLRPEREDEAQGRR